MTQIQRDTKEVEGFYRFNATLAIMEKVRSIENSKENGS